MREIKLRAWDKKHKQMVNLDTPTAFCESGYDEIDYIAFSKGDARYVDSNQVVWVEQYELMQYTGLKDKNGVEIYEGDIVKYFTNYYGNKKERKRVVEWIDDMQDDSFGEPLSMGYRFHGSGIEVVGNIWENPELLEANQ